MKIAIIGLLFILGGAFAQEEELEEEEEVVELDASVDVLTDWPQNDYANAGGIVTLVYSAIGEGSCIVSLPDPVNLFHVMNGHIVTGDDTSPIEGRYKINAPAGWEAINGTLRVLIIFNRDQIFNFTDLTFTCDGSDVEDTSVYSFPQNTLVKEASSNVHFRPGFHKGDVLTITLNDRVKRFNITGADSELVIDSEDGQTFTVSGFKNEIGVDEQKEVHFSLEYYKESENDTSHWFSTGDITVDVAVGSDEEEPEVVV